jgi:hypothetical protein
MPDSEIRRAVSGSRREGRRSHSAYESHARGDRHDVPTRLAVGAAPARLLRRGTLQAVPQDWTAGFALALVYPLVAHMHPRKRSRAATETTAPPHGHDGKGTGGMTRKPTISSLETVSSEEATAYLHDAGGDELDAACALAWDRNRLDGSNGSPDDAEVHHALFLLCRARGKQPPSFDEMRVELRRRIAA